MVNAVNIRKISPADMASIQEIRKAISKEDESEEFIRFLERQVSDESGESNLVAEIKGRVVGYMISTILYAGFGLKKSAWIMAIGVHPDYMGQGIGLELACKTCDIYKAKGVDNIYSSVLWDSTDVLSFFKKLGFERSDFINLKRKL
jgi:N-acetylglutamate synthase-like GNAT family acetyltransferase